MQNFWNSVISTPNGKFMGIDVKNFYLNTPLDRPEYMRFHVDDIPEEIIQLYSLHDIMHDGYVYCEINKGMYGLKQAGKLANDLLEERLSHKGYLQSRHTPGLWSHSTKDTKFALIVDDFGVKYTSRADAQHLIDCLKEDYEDISVDWDGKLFAGISLDWDYENQTVDLSMPKYIPDALHKFQHPMPTHPQDSPHPCNAPQYGVKVQQPEPLDTSPPASAKDKQYIQQVIGTLLYHARSIDSTTLVALSSIAADQANPTEDTLKRTKQLLDYVATHPDAVLRYVKSDMQLRVDSDASYLNAPNARSRIGGHHYLSNAPPLPDINNGAILNPSSVLKVVVSSAAEAEYAALFENGKAAVLERITLEELGHKQEPTRINTDNSTACGIANNSVKQQRSRAMDMRFHWIRDRVKQGQFDVNWEPGKSNRGDYFTKHFSAAHHRRERPNYLHVASSQPQALLTLLRGCVETPAVSPGLGSPVVHQTLSSLAGANDSSLDQRLSAFKSPTRNPNTVII